MCSDSAAMIMARKLVDILGWHFGDDVEACVEVLSRCIDSHNTRKDDEGRMIAETLIGARDILIAVEPSPQRLLSTPGNLRIGTSQI